MKNRKIKWRGFCDSPRGWRVLDAEPVQKTGLLVGLRGRDTVDTVYIPGSTPYFHLLLTIIPFDRKDEYEEFEFTFSPWSSSHEKSQQCILVDVERDVWVHTWALRVVNWPNRYHLTKADRDLIYSQIEHHVQ